MTYSALRIEKMPKGGFVVTEAGSDPRCVTWALFACTDIGEALGFIRSQLGPQAGNNPGAVAGRWPVLDGG